MFGDRLTATDPSWIGSEPEGLGQGLRCRSKIRYRQEDQECVVACRDDGTLEVEFDARQKAIAPGQFVVFYTGDRCLGGAVIDKSR